MQHFINCYKQYFIVMYNFVLSYRIVILLLLLNQNDTYGELFVNALHNFGILCLGLYRQMDPRPSAGSFNRVVITNPPAELLLYPSDKV